MTCSPMEGDNPPSWFVLKIWLKRRVFEILELGEKFVRSAFFVGSGTRKDGHF